MDHSIWIVGAGEMAIHYAKVLKHQGVDFIVVGRSQDSAGKFQQEVGMMPFVGGIHQYLSTKPACPQKAIVTVGIEALAETAILLMKYGVREILLEKPGVGAPKEIDSLVDAAEKTGSRVLLAYNRRFYSSVLRAEEIIRDDGGVKSFCFEFTEWSHVIAPLKKTKVEHNYWFLGNSTHVIDTAFFLGGKPRIINALHSGGIDWHPASSVFVGSGESDKGALFSYHANWQSPGRWWIELLTSKHRLIFKPMETLQIQKIGSVAIGPVEIDDELDKNFKPGLFLQTKSFLNDDYSRFSDILEQKFMIDNFYLKMSGY